MAKRSLNIAKPIRQARGYVLKTDPSIKEAKSRGLRQKYGENAVI